MVEAEPNELADPDAVRLEPSSPTERLDRLEKVISDHLAEMQALSRDAIRRAYADADQLREAAALGGLRPLLNELLAIHDDLTRLITHYGSAGHAEPREVVDNLEGIRTQLDEALARRGVVYLSPTAARFDRDTQRAVRVESASDPAADLAVISEVRPGFIAPGGVIRRTDVVIARYQPGPAVAPQSQEPM
jgi:molecular chaperone GrpE (heat shock protein)